MYYAGGHGQIPFVRCVKETCLTHQPERMVIQVCEHYIILRGIRMTFWETIYREAYKVHQSRLF